MPPASVFVSIKTGKLMPQYSVFAKLGQINAPEYFVILIMS